MTARRDWRVLHSFLEVRTLVVIVKKNDDSLFIIDQRAGAGLGQVSAIAQDRAR